MRGRREWRPSGRFIRQAPEGRRHVQQRAALMVPFRPPVALGAIGGWRAFSADCAVPSAVFRVDLVSANEGPLLFKGGPITRRFLAEALVHEQQAVETFGLNPPDFFLRQVSAERRGL